VLVIMRYTVKTLSQPKPLVKLLRARFARDMLDVQRNRTQMQVILRLPKSHAMVQTTEVIHRVREKLEHPCEDWLTGAEPRILPHH
jgi:hypothetical protein